MAHGNIGSQLADNPDLYISRDGGVSWYQTLAGSWGVTVVDHGGLLVAADDYHKDPSMVLKYSCDEGLSWNDYTYTTTEMTVFGVITEPGEETTTVRCVLYSALPDSFPLEGVDTMYTGSVHTYISRLFLSHSEKDS